MSDTEVKGGPAANNDVGEIVQRWKDKRGSLIMALHDMQDRHGYIPREAAMNLARQMCVPLARIYEVITFYNFFRLKPPGRHVVSVCMGTACYLKGAPKLLDEVSRHLGAKPGHTSADGRYHLQMVRCVGCCGLAPVVLVDGVTLGKASAGTVQAHVCSCADNGSRKEQECRV